MEVPLAVVLVNHTGLFQQVVDDVASHRGALPTRRWPERERGGGGERGEDKAGVLRQDVEFIMQFVLDNNIVQVPKKGVKREE